MKNNLLIGLLGHSNSGKSTTWDLLFKFNPDGKRKVKTGSKMRPLYLSKTEYIWVFLVYGSPEERGLPISNIIGDLKPAIILCSIQYTSFAQSTVNYLIENEYFLYIQWLNPGYKDTNNIAYSDYTGIINRILASDSTMSIRNAKQPPDSRVQEIRDFLYGWAHSRNLIQTIK